ncbi:uncharacterized protein LOC143291611 [Babylonia areolata]|uniref:uncharacterized protein LOC143291611 n=1 Tax=Babylonia areolata TaxID=304850 RepID=UPI003FD5F080
MAACQFSEADIFAEDFPDDISISALCDCGRHKRMHTLATYKPGPRAPMPETDYQSTFKAKNSPRPRSSKRPPPTPRNPNPAPMTFETNQRSEFKNLGHVERVKPIVHEEQYEPPHVPMETKTFYAQEYIPKHLSTAGGGAAVPSSAPCKKDTLRVPSVPIDARTTNKETYKPWLQQPALAFGELPSFTGSILFPERKPLPESTMRYSYQGKFVPPVPPIKMGEPSIRLEGNHTFDTTHGVTYKGVKGDHRVLPMVQKATVPAGKRGRFNGETQSKRDFPGYGGRQPVPPKAADPAPTTIDLKFDNKRSFSTENRATFRGHNVVEHPAPRSCKTTEEEFIPPTVKFETETSQKRDYQPIDVSVAAMPKASIPQSIMAPAGEATFDGVTMNSEFFKNWGAPPRVRFGDFHENRPYVPPQHPFKGESVTKSSFVPKKAEPVTLYKPSERPSSKVGAKVDYTTSYGDEYQKKQARMCRAQVFLLQQELKRRRRQQQLSSAPAAKPIAVK